MVHIKNVKKNRLRRVVNLEDGRVLLINAATFDPNLHGEPEAEDEAAARQAAAVGSKQREALRIRATQNSSQSLEELAVMTMEALKDTPEFRRSSERQRKRVGGDKDKVIELILSMRKG
jgi:hypothetical protein